MTWLKKLSVFFFSLLIMAACKSKKVSLSGEDPVEVSDFIDFFPETTLPFQVADSNLLRREKDSLLISNKIFTQFVPDSILQKNFGKNAKPKIYPLGKVKGDETYLFVKALAAEKRTALALAFDKKDKFIAALPLLTLDQSPATQQSGVMDTRYTFTKSTFRKNKDGSTSEGKDVYALNSGGGEFTLVMTDALDDKVAEVTNPIDTFARKQKFTADYGSGKMNVVSFRDGRKPDRLSFFIHFEKNNGECTGELKGEAVLKSPNVAEYREAGDPCGLRFNFTSSSVTIKEMGGCGSRRGLRCSFDGVYPRKKEVKPKTTKTKAKTSKS